jgi:hypothetical protein
LANSIETECDGRRNNEKDGTAGANNGRGGP